jgi:hypothetical protein
MARENIPGDERVVATGASGFGIMALMVGVDRGFITREQGVQRLTRIVTFSSTPSAITAPWSHYMDGKHRPDHGRVLACSTTAATWSRLHFSCKDCSPRASISGEPARRINPSTAESRSFGKRSNGDWYRETPSSDFLYWHWSPEWAFQIHHPLIGFNEVMITYLLGIASPTHAVPADMYYSGWASQSERGDQLSAGMVRQRRRQSLRQQTHLLRNQA